MGIEFIVVNRAVRREGICHVVSEGQGAEE